MAAEQTTERKTYCGGREQHQTAGPVRLTYLFMPESEIESEKKMELGQWHHLVSV